MKEVGSLEGVHGSQFSYSLLCKSLKFYIKPWFFLMVIYAIAITTYSYIINMCVFVHSQGAESPVIEAVVLISSYVVHTVRTSQALKSCQFIQHCSNLRACVNSSWLSGPLEWGLLWRNTSPQHWDFQQQALYEPLHSLSDPNHCSVLSCSLWMRSLQSEISERSQECG